LMYEMNVVLERLKRKKLNLHLNPFPNYYQEQLLNDVFSLIYFPLRHYLTGIVII